jgi:hypothetical protein
MWLVPAGVFFVGVVLVLDALRRLNGETRQLVQRMATVRAETADVQRLRAEARALAASVRGATRR